VVDFCHAIKKNKRTSKRAKSSPTTSKRTKSKRTTSKSKTGTAKRATKKKSFRNKSQARPKKVAAKKQSQAKTSSKALSRKRNPARDAQRLESSWGREVAAAAGQSGDLEGLSRAEQADSESVDELVDEGNAFEAGVVSGVEEADDSDMREVHTREVPEDDVPEEYLDKD
jgi:hypothetical protein